MTSWDSLYSSTSPILITHKYFCHKTTWPYPQHNLWTTLRLKLSLRDFIKELSWHSWQKFSSSKNIPGVNFINILCKALIFIQNCLAQLFSYYSLALYFFVKKIIGAKAARKLLMKLPLEHFFCLRADLKKSSSLLQNWNWPPRLLQCGSEI
jgi:hypothetical protein